MTSLLIQSCSATKEAVDTPVPALDLYDGYFFRIIKKAVRTNRFQPGLDITIISAKHGVVEPDDHIGYYDQEMDTERANELNDEIIDAIASKVVEHEYEKVWVNLGKDYMPAVDGIDEAVDVPVLHIEGSGIGMKGKQLKHLVSSSRSIPTHGD
ncbi:DUF6884 domain-containing protein [Natrinema halophilum]|uniref:Peroxide stress protein YaaA n=1 Tax=Natrinema halophilum TaxID=1699371 RepID=A0A7D5KEY9_9EURY|nr:DUF6884 domain-containing protein [Natrinema halophilum]QLG50656.1 hypothetical protein HYG82_18355 [Natrinema halophilum]